jgi:hypothetical protein
MQSLVQSGLRMPTREDVHASVEQVKTDIRATVRETYESWSECYADVKHECLPELKPSNYYVEFATKILRSWIHIPYFPAFHRPGWMLRYIVGPHDRDWLESIVADIVAGITVALTLIPQVQTVKRIASYRVCPKQISTSFFS